MQALIIISIFLILSANCARHQIQVVVPPPLSLGGGPPASRIITPSSYIFPSTQTGSDKPQTQENKELRIERKNQSITQEHVTVVNDNTCNQLWTQVYNLTEEILDSHPKTSYKRVLDAFRQVLEDIGAPLLIDTISSAIGPKEQRSIAREVEKLRKKFSQLENRRNILEKYPEYNSLLENFKKNMANFDGQCKNATGEKASLCNSCYMPAYIADFILNSILLKEETGKEIVTFQESVSSIFDMAMKGIKKRTKPQKPSRRQPERVEQKGAMLEQKEIKILEKFQSALKGGRGSGSENVTSVLVIVVIFIILVIFIAILALSRRKK
jgi:cobalamin biosynthesis Co2+ chelatase CbiK